MSRSARKGPEIDGFIECGKRFTIFFFINGSSLVYFTRKQFVQYTFRRLVDLEK